MRARCPGCGQCATADHPHFAYTRLSGPEWGARDEGHKLIAEGYDPATTSALWFQCWNCRMHFPAFTEFSHNLLAAETPTAGPLLPEAGRARDPKVA